MQYITDFIVTVSEPAIAWIPRHANATTTSLINHRREEVINHQFTYYHKERPSSLSLSD